MDLSGRRSRVPMAQNSNVDKVNLGKSRCYSIYGLELKLYFAVWIVHSAIAVALTYQASKAVSLWFNSALRDSPYNSNYGIDDSDSEWMLFRESITTILTYYSVHCVLFKIVQKIPSRSQESLVLIFAWMAMFVKVHSATCLLICLGLAIIVTALTLLVRHEMVAWILCVGFVLNSGPNIIPYTQNPAVYYREYQMYVYIAVKILNFCIYICRTKAEINPRLWLMFVEYLFYPPYCSTLIVLFDDYVKQRNNLNKVNWPQIAWLALRLTFWFFFVEFALHFLRFNSYFNAPFTMMANLHNYYVVSIAYLAGQYFHTKYVVIFGVARLFAHADGMQPPEGAICISRVTKYSRMWRYFDRGLYQFLKRQLYIPFLGHGNALEVAVRRFVAMTAVFSFVLCWHGVNANYTYWVVLSAIELVIERIGYYFYTSSYGTTIRNYVGEANFARLSAVACITNVIPGIFGAFFFLDKKNNGAMIFNNVLYRGAQELFTLNVHPYNAGFVLGHLLCLGYCFSHVCAYLNAKLDQKVKTE